MKVIDLRSDTVTLPSASMQQVMFDAPLGDDVYGEDPTVNKLEWKLSKTLGKQAGLFLPSGTMSNLVALMAHCERGDEYIVGQDAHTYKYEAGGAAVLGSIQPQPLPFNERGELDLKQVANAIKPDDSHFANTKLLCLENTVGGKVLSLEYMQQAKALADQHGLQLHLDGARAFNAAVKLKCDIAELVKPFDSVSICLSKGLGAPVGSVLVGSRKLIKRARRIRKMLGGGMRQAGILAAAGLYAIEHNVQRLAEDHQRAELLAKSLGDIRQVIQSQPVETNMVFIKVPKPFEMAAYLQQQDILISPDKEIRLVTHLDITDEAISKLVQTMAKFYRITS
jgi:threonine aldolase